MKENNYYQVSGWMRTELDLKGNELQVYAIIYGFSQDGKSCFSGSRQYLADWLGVVRPTIDSALKSLVNKGLVEKQSEIVNNVKFNKYRCILQGVSFFDRGCKKFLHNNNTYNDSIKEEKEIYKEKDNGKDTAPSGANTKNTLGSAFIGVEVENKDTSFIATTALGNEQKESSVAENIETDNGKKASTTGEKLDSVKKITEAEIITYFAKTWEMYPRKVNKVQALKTYGYKLNGLSEEEAKKNANKIYTTLKKQIEVWANEGEHGREFEFMPHFSTWLNANFTDSNGKARCR